MSNEPVLISGSQNLTPTWMGIQHMWRWIDENHDVRPGNDNTDGWNLAGRSAWWEDMVESTVENCGRINVA